MEAPSWAVYYLDTGVIQTSGLGTPSDADIIAWAGGIMDGRGIWRGVGDVSLNVGIDINSDPPALVPYENLDQAAIVAKEVPGAKIDKQREAWATINRFVATLPLGLPRYDTNFQAAALAFDKSAMTPEQLAKYAAVFNWISMVWAEYDSIKAQLASAVTLADVEAVELDLSGYEIGSGLDAADPDISIADIRPA